MSKKAIIRELQIELASRGRDLWTQVIVISDLKDQIEVLEAIIVEQEMELMREKKP